MSGKQNGFSKIPLARKIEALVLTAVTVIASASVDWSSLTARAEDTYPYDGSLTTMVELDQSNPVIKREVIGKGGNQADNTPMYLGIHSAYMNVQLSEGATAHYEVAIYQNYADDADYTTATSVRSGNEIASGDLTQYDNVITLWDWPDDKNALVYLASGEKATIEVTFSNISDGAVISYGQDSESNPIAIGTKYEDTFSDAELVSENGRTSYVAVTNGNAIDFTNDFSLSPSYKRNIYYKLAVGEPDSITDVTSIASSSGYTATSHASIAVDDTQKLLTPGTESGVDTLLVFSGNDSSKWLKIPVRIVAPNINYTGLTYDGNSVSIVTPSCGPNVLIEGTDFFATYSGEDKQGNHYNDDVASNIRNAGDYTVTLTGAAGTAYEGLSYSETFSIAPKDIKEVATGSDMQVDPAALSVTNADGALTDNGQNLIKDYDYTVDKVERDAADNAKYSITITGKGNYTGTRVIQSSNSLSGTVDLNTLVNKLMLTRAVGNTTDGAVYVFDAAAHNEPGIYFYDLNNTRLNLKLHDDYEYAIRDNSTQAVVYDSVTPSAITYAGAVNAGNYTVEIRGRGNYTGTIKSTDFSDQVFQIQRRPLTYNNFIVKISPVTFVADDTVHQPTSVTAEYRYGTDGAGRWTMRQGVDYNYAFDQTKDANTYAVKIIPLETGNFSGETKDFTNHQQAAAGTAVAVLDANPDLVHPESVYKYEIIASLDKAEVCLTDGNIFPDANVANAGTSWFSDYSAVYDGNAKQPKVQVKIGAHELSQYVNDTTTPNADYKVIYDPTKETNVGEASLIIQGMNKFEGQPILTVKYTITPISLAAGDLTVSKEKTYDPNGKAATLANGEYSVSHDKKSLSEGTDFVLEYENNTDQGDATVTAKGIGNYTGSAIAVMKINPFDFTKSTDFTIKSIPDQSYTGSEIKPDEKGLVVVQYKGWKTLEKDVDYKVTYEKGTNIKTTDKAKVIITGLGNYTGVKYTTFRIKTKSLLDGVTYRIGGTKTGTLSGTTNTGYTEEYTGKPSTPNIELNNGALRNGVDYTVSTSSAIRAGKRTITITGIGNYAGTEAKLVYVVIPKALTSAKAVPVASGASTSGAIQTGTDAIKRYYKVQIGSGSNVLTLTPASITYNADGTAASVTDSGDYTFQWTQPDGTELAENQIPSIAGEGYTLKITGHGNYSGSVSIVRDGSAAKNKLMVGASVDAVDVIDILGRSSYSVPYLGSNLPAVYLESGKLTSTNTTDNPYNKNIVISGGSLGALAGPDYENGQYKNDTAKDYTVHFVPGTTASKDDAAAELSSLPVNTQFKVRVSAVAGSKLFFGSHQTERVFTVSATDLSDFGKKTTGYPDGQLTVSDTAAAEPYVVSNGAVVSAAAISYEYTGSTITPKLSVTFVPVTPDSSKFNGTFAPINLLSYATVAPASIEANVASNQNFTLTANTGSGFSGTLNIPYEVTKKTITQEMIGWSGTPSAVYDGKSKKATIEGMIQVTDNGKTVSAGDYSYTLCDATGTAIAITADESAFTNVGKIYVKVTGTNNYSGSAIGVTPFEITAKSVNNVSISLDGQDETKDLYIKYTGSSVAQPKVEVSDGTKPLTGSSNKDGSDGDYYYNANDPACLTTGAGIGVKTVTIYGKNNYGGTQKSRKFYVYGNLTDETDIIPDGIVDNAVYILNEKGQPVLADSDGKTIKSGASPLSLKNVKFKAGDTELNSDSYTVSVTTTTDTPASESSLQYPGKYIVTYTGAGESKLCTGTRKFTITVKGDLATAEVQGIESVYPYSENVSDERPEEADILVQLAGSGNKVSPDDYTITYDKAQAIEPNAQEGDITLTISPKKDSLYVGKFTKSYDIKYNLEDADIEATEGKVPVMGDTAADITKDKKITVTVAGKKLTVGTDYLITSAEWGNANKTSNTASLTVTIGPDNGEKFSYNTCEATLETEKKSIAAASLSKDSNTISYDGKDHLDEQNKAIKVKLDKKTLKLGDDYAIKWTDSKGKTVTSLTNAGTYTAAIEGVYQYSGEATQKYTLIISLVDISGAKVEPKDANQEYYTGKEPVLDYNVTVDGLTLTQDKDFTAEITNPNPKPSAWNANTDVTVTIAAKGSNFTGSTTYGFTIKPINLADSTKLLSIKSTAVYNGKVQTPSFVIVRIDSSGKEIENGTLKEGDDYEITTIGSGFIDAGKYDCVIKGKNSGNYTGEFSYAYEIAPKPISDGSIKVSLDKSVWDYNDGNEITPAVTVTDSAITAKPGLTVDKDYKVTYENNKDSHASTGDGAPVVKIAGNGNYTGERTETFQIGTDISQKSELKLEEDSFDYDGEAHAPAVEKLTINDPSGKKLETLYADDIPASTHVALSYQDENSSAKGTYTVTISGKGPYFGDVTASYEIKANKANGAEIDVALKGQSGDGSQTDSEGSFYYYYSGNKYTPDAVVKYVPDDNDDTQTKTLTGGSVAEDAVATVETDHPDWDYYLTYGDDNTNAGKGTVTVHLINNYSGTKTVRFEIKAVDLSDLTLKLHGTKEEFDGTAKTKDFELTGKNKAGQTLEDMTFAGTPDEEKAAAVDKGLAVTFESNVSPGTAVILVAPIAGGNFTGDTLNASFTIQGDLDKDADHPAAVSAAAIFRTGEEPDVEAGDITIDFVDSDGVSHVIRPEWGWYTVSDPEPVDVTDWTSASKYTVTVEPTKAGKAFLTGDRTVTGELSSSPTGLTIEGFKYSYQYTGAPIKPGKDDGVVVKTNGKALPSSFDVAYTYSSDAGDDCISIGKVKITATVSYTDASGTTQKVTTDKDQYGLEASYRIVQRPIKTCNISMKDSVTYTGDELKPPITINTGSKELVAGTDYYTEYSNNQNPGIAKVVIHATSGGNFTGQATKTFNIYVASVTGVTATSVSTTSAKISWNASDHVTGYRLNYLDGSGNVKNILTTSTSATVTGLSTTDSTQVALQAYVKDSSGNTYYGPTNFLYAKTALATATVSGTANVSANNITWTNVTNANGYEVWRAEGDGGYELMRATVPQGTYTFRDTQVTSGTKYSYRIRAYKINTSNGTKYGYSEYSTPVTLTAR